MKRSYGIILAVMMSILAGCDDSPECSAIDAPHCSPDGKGILTCEDGRWVNAPCDSGLACANIGSGVLCVDESAISVCLPGTTHCYDGGILQTCSVDGHWEFRACGTNMACRNGVCREVITHVTPGGEVPTDPDTPDVPTDPDTPDVPTDPDTPEDPVSGSMTVRCNGPDVEYVDEEGAVTRLTCMEDVGFAGQCEAFGSGLAGCALPSACDDAFSVAGTCAGDRRLWCDERYIVPKPSVEDCAVQGARCAMDAGAAYCVKACSASGFSCSKSGDVEMVAGCREYDGISGSRTAASLCEDAATAVTCVNGAVVETACGADEACYDSLGICAPKCESSDAGSVMCRADGAVLLCQKIYEGYAYVSVGRRHCKGDTLIQCAENDGAYALREVDCTAYEKEGAIIVGTCVTDYNYYEDMDICLANVEGDPCGDLTNDGICDGNILKYCDDTYHLASSSDCSKNKDGFNTCSVYEGYADCRKSCKTSGAAACSYQPSYEAYLVTLCAPDAQSGSLVEIEGSSICLGESLYACDADGNTMIKDCTADGGRCDVDRCVYPACRLSEDAVCLVSGGGLSCEVHEDGHVVGTTIDKDMCKPV